MAISDLVNAPIEFILGGKKLKIQRLSISELFTPAENHVLEEYQKSTFRWADKLEGKAREDFIHKKSELEPFGIELERKANEYLSTAVGVAQLLMIALNKCQEISEVEVTELIQNSSEAELNFLKDFLSGDKESKKKLREEQTKVAEEVKVVKVV